MSSEQREVDGATKLAVAFLDWVYTENIKKEVIPVERSIYVSHVFLVIFLLMAYLCVTGKLPECVYQPLILGIPWALFWSFVGMAYSALCIAYNRKRLNRKWGEISERMKVWYKILENFLKVVREDKTFYMKIRKEFPEFFSEVEKNPHKDN